MNFSFYLLGNPDGYNQYLTWNSAKFREVLNSCKTESQLSIFRNEQLVQYVFVRKVPGNEKLLLGFALVFTGVYCTDCHVLNDLFDKAFYDVLLKGELLRFQKDKYKYMVSKFADNLGEIERIHQFFKKRIDDEVDKYFVHIPTSFYVGRGEQTLSVQESNDDINTAVANFDTVHLTNTEKAVSELERTQNMLSDLYSRHQQLEDDYRKVLNQKRNFKLVVVLSLVLLGCIVGFWLLRGVLNNKDNEIHGLEGELKAWSDTIKVQSEKIMTLSNEKQSLCDSIHSLGNIIASKNDTMNVLQKEKEELQNERINLQNNISILREDNEELIIERRRAVSQLKDSIRTIRRLRNNIREETNKRLYGERYKVWSSSGSKATIYYRYGEKYEKMTWAINDNAEIRVYRIDGDYAVTNVGYLRVIDIKKQ